MTKTDLIIIGAGPGGYRAAEYAAKQGLKVTVFEPGEVGGTCLNVGCIPTKTYVHSASFDEARERMPQVVSQLRAGVETILSHPNITLVRGRAAFVDAHTVTCPLCGDIVATKGIIIATGSETRWLPLPGADNPRVVDSTGLLRLDTLPKRLAVIGAGVIGMEFASVFRRFGSEVTVIEYLKECLPALDSDIAKRLRKVLEKEGITFHLQCAVKQIDNGTVHFETKKGQAGSVDADIILMATGRKPRTEGLNLQAAGITLAPNGSIPVDDHFQAAVVPAASPQASAASPSAAVVPAASPSAAVAPAASPSAAVVPNASPSGIYAIGDVNGRQMLAHAAEMQGIQVVNHILGRQDGIRLDIMPAAIFTEPEAACVGPTEDQLKAQGIAYECRKAFWRANGKALAMGETEGVLKLLTAPTTATDDPDSGRILGCHAFGAHAADIIQEVSVLMCMGATVAQLRQMVHIHPTLSEILLSAAEG